jgi:hypothetical protein
MDDPNVPLAENQVEPSPQSPPFKLRMNRDVDKAAQEIAEKHTPPNPPAKTMTWDQMLEYVKLFTSEMWTHVMLYVYRLRPKIIRQLLNPDLPNYIDCISEPQQLTVEAMTKKHGGGKYMIEATDDTRRVAGKPSTQLFRCFFTIDDTAHEPKINYEELDVHARENLGYLNYLQHKGIFDSKGRLIQGQQGQQAAQQPQNGMNSDIVEKVLGFVSKERENEALRAAARNSENGGLQGAVGSILIEKMKQDDPAKNYAQMTGMMDSMLKGLTSIVSSSKPNDATDLYKSMIEMQDRNNKAYMSLFEKLAEKKEAEEKGDDDLAKLEKLMNVASRLAEMGPRGGRRGWAEIALDAGREIGVPLLGTIQNIFALQKGQPAAAAQAVPQRMPGFDPYARPDLGRQAAQQMAAQNPPPQPQPNPAPVPQPAPPVAGQANAPAELVTTLQTYGGVVLGALNSGQGGAVFADNLVNMFGAATHASIANFGIEAMVASMLAVPQIALFGEPKLRQFAFEFVNFEEILEQEEEESKGAD